MDSILRFLFFDCALHCLTVTKNDVTACLSFVGKRHLPFYLTPLFSIVGKLNREGDQNIDDSMLYQ